MTDSSKPVDASTTRELTNEHKYTAELVVRADAGFYFASDGVTVALNANNKADITITTGTGSDKLHTTLLPDETTGTAGKNFKITVEFTATNA